MHVFFLVWSSKLFTSFQKFISWINLHCVKLVWIWIVFIRIFPFLKIYWDLKVLLVIITCQFGNSDLFGNEILIKLNNFLICIFRKPIVKSTCKLIAFRRLLITVKQSLIVLKHQMNFRLTLISFIFFSFKHILFSYEIFIVNCRVEIFILLIIVNCLLVSLTIYLILLYLIILKSILLSVLLRKQPCLLIRLTPK